MKDARRTNIHVTNILDQIKLPDTRFSFQKLTKQWYWRKEIQLETLFNTEGKDCSPVIVDKSITVSLLTNLSLCHWLRALPRPSRYFANLDWAADLLPLVLVPANIVINTNLNLNHSLTTVITILSNLPLQYVAGGLALLYK